MTDSVSLDDVEGLWKVGAVTLPNIAVKFSAASRAVHQAGAADDVFTVPAEENPCEVPSPGDLPIGPNTPLNPGDPSEPASGKSPIFEPYTALLTLFQDTVLVRSSRNCVTAGEVLCRIADSFATVDNLNGTELEKYSDFQKDIEDGRIAGSRIPYVPEATASGDPHPDDYGNVRGY